jgi:hypothetical protein
MLIPSWRLSQTGLASRSHDGHRATNDRDANTYGIRAVESCRARHPGVFQAPPTARHRRNRDLLRKGACPIARPIARVGISG